jgi:hypothetical protein
MLPFAKATLKLSRSALQSLDWWLRYVLTKPVDNNYYTALMLLVVGDVWQSKVHPKMAVVKPETKMKLNEQQALALSICFMEFDYFDAPVDYQGHLYTISQSLPKLRYDEAFRFSPPLIYEASSP